MALERVGGRKGVARGGGRGRRGWLRVAGGGVVGAEQRQSGWAGQVVLGVQVRQLVKHEVVGGSGGASSWQRCTGDFTALPSGLAAGP